MLPDGRRLALTISVHGGKANLVARARPGPEMTLSGHREYLAWRPNLSFKVRRPARRTTVSRRTQSPVSLVGLTITRAPASGSAAIVSADVAGYSRLIGRDESDTMAA
jgi:hypothetical protein